MRIVLAIFVVAGVLVSVNCGSAYQDGEKGVISVTASPVNEVPVTSSPFGGYNDFWQYLLAIRLQQLENYYNSLPPINSVNIPPKPVKKDCQPVGGFVSSNYLHVYRCSQVHFHKISRAMIKFINKQKSLWRKAVFGISRKIFQKKPFSASFQFPI